MRRPLALALLALLAACDSGPVVTPGPAVALSVVASADGDSPFTDTLGTFRAAWGRPYPLNLSQGLQYRFPNSGGFAYEALLDGADLDGDRSDVYVFMVSRYDGGPEVSVAELRAKKRRDRAGSRPGLSTRTTPGLSLPQVRFADPNPVSDMRLFFIDGVGESPPGPVEVAFYPLDDDYNLLPSQVSVWVDPARHTLRSGPALSVGLPDLGVRVADRPYTRFRVTYEPDPTLQPLLIWRESAFIPWTPSLRSGGAFEVGRRLTPAREGFEARLYTLDIGDLARSDP